MDHVLDIYGLFLFMSSLASDAFERLPLRALGFFAIGAKTGYFSGCRLLS